MFYGRKIFKHPRTRTVGGAFPVQLTVLKGGVLAFEAPDASGRAHLRKLDAATGEITGSIQLPESLRAPPNTAALGDMLFICAGGVLEAFDTRSLESRWRVDAPAKLSGIRRLALTHDAVICQRRGGLEAFALADGASLWEIDRDEDPFAIAGDYLYTDYVRVTLATGETVPFMSPGLEPRPDWRFVSKDRLFFEDRRETVRSLDRQRPQISERAARNERPRAIHGSYVITQSIARSNHWHTFHISRMTDRRVSSTPPSIVGVGQEVLYRPQVQLADGSDDLTYQITLESGPDWLTLSADKQALEGIAPVSSSGPPQAVVLRLESPNEETLYHSFAVQVLETTPQSLTAPHALRVVPGELHTFTAHAEAASEIDYALLWNGNVISQSADGRLVMPPLAEQQSGSFTLRAGQHVRDLLVEPTWNAKWVADPYLDRTHQGLMISESDHRWTKELEDILMLTQFKRLTADNVLVYADRLEGLVPKGRPAAVVVARSIS